MKLSWFFLTCLLVVPSSTYSFDLHMFLSYLFDAVVYCSRHPEMVMLGVIIIGRINQCFADRWFNTKLDTKFGHLNQRMDAIESQLVEGFNSVVIKLVDISEAIKEVNTSVTSGFENQETLINTSTDKLEGGIESNANKLTEIRSLLRSEDGEPIVDKVRITQQLNRLEEQIAELLAFKHLLEQTQRQQQQTYVTHSLVTGALPLNKDNDDTNKSRFSQLSRLTSLLPGS